MSPIILEYGGKSASAACRVSHAVKYLNKMFYLLQKRRNKVQTMSRYKKEQVTTNTMFWLFEEVFC